MAIAVFTASCRTRRTPFSERIEAQGVKGYTVYNHMLLPTVFRSMEEDYRHLKRHVQVWDVGCQRQVELSGPDAARLAQLMTPRDLSRARVGQCFYAPLVDEAGGIVNDPVLLKLGDDRFWLSVADSDVVLWAKGIAYGLGLRVRVFEPEVWPLAVQGPKAEELVARIFGDDVRDIRFFHFARLPFEGRSFVVSRSGWSKQGGFEIYVDDAEAGVALYDALFAEGADLEVGPGCPNLIERIEGGLLSYGADMTIANNPFECGLERYCALDAPIEFLGRRALERVRAQGGPRRMIRGVRFEGPPCAPCSDRWPVLADDRRIGAVSSAAYSPDLGANIGLAMLDRGFWDAMTAVVIETPAGPREGVVSDLPFITKT